MFAPENSDTSMHAGHDGKGNEIGYPVHVYFIEMSKMYMHRIRWHWHPELEIIIINQGKMDLITDDTGICLNTGQGILVNQNVMHSLQPTDPAMNCSLYSVTFHPSFLFGYGNTAMSGKYLSPVLDAATLKTILLDNQNNVSRQLIDTIHSVIVANMEKKYGYELITKSFLCQFWVLLLDLIAPHDHMGAKPNILSLDEARVKDAIIYIEGHYSEQITLEQLAASIHISKSECCRCFKRTLQLTPIEYLMRYRILKATAIIQNNDPAYQSISDLAFSVGFNNVSYFNKVFKQYIKCTPSEYKKRLKSMSADAVFPTLNL